MLDYDFLKIISEQIRMFREFPLPAAICDTQLQVYWSNSQAKDQYPRITRTGDLREILAEYHPEALLEEVEEKGNCVIADVFPMSGVGLSLSPVVFQGQLVGLVLLVLRTDILPETGRVFQGSRSMGMLCRSIRESVGETFDAMDNVALKADMMQAGWIKTGLQRVAVEQYHILRILENIAQYAQYQTGAFRLQATPMDLLELLRNLREPVEEMGQALGVAIEFAVGQGPAYVQADRRLFETALFNLLNNSLYFTRPGNHIQVAATRVVDELRITVRDHGLGIPQAYLSQVTRPYMVYDHGGKGAGTGLGLTVAHIVARAHQGTLDVESEEGVGTAVSMRLPVGGFSQNIPLRQEDVDAGWLVDRFSTLYTGLTDAALSPYRDMH